MAYVPRRDDDVASWLKRMRDEWSGVRDDRWWAYNDALDTYRLHADLGVPLNERTPCDGPCREDHSNGA